MRDGDSRLNFTNAMQKSVNQARKQSIVAGGRTRFSNLRSTMNHSATNKSLISRDPNTKSSMKQYGRPANYGEQNKISNAKELMDYIVRKNAK